MVARYDGIQEPTLRTPIKTSEIYALAASNSSLHRNSDSHSGAHWCHHTAKDDFHRGRSTVPRAIRWPTPSCFVGCLQSIYSPSFPHLQNWPSKNVPDSDGDTSAFFFNHTDQDGNHSVSLQHHITSSHEIEISSNIFIYIYLLCLGRGRLWCCAFISAPSVPRFCRASFLASCL